MKRIVFGVMAAALGVFAAEPASQATVTVDLTREIGPIKPMHAVNNGPSVSKPGGDQLRGNFEDYKAARIPFARLHDSINCVSGGAHSVDVNAIFRDFDADENDPANYDFVFTDHYLDTIRRAGTEVYFRLGQTIEHGPKKYGALPPKDFGKWARICEHIIRHYNEGWGWGTDQAYTTVNVAWSNQFNIVYWEIWNEPDLDPVDVGLPKNPRCWGGTVTNFFEFYETAAKHLKGKFPNLKIGGPALCGNEKWGRRFIAYCRDNKVPLDFYSWHIYSRTPGAIAERCTAWRRILDENGFTKTESILNEWNYVKGWCDDWVYSLRSESGDNCLKGAAFIASTMIQCQNRPLDLLMFYDARLGTAMNNLFDLVTYWPKKGYYPFYLWSKMVDRGTQIGCAVSVQKSKESNANTGNVEKKDKPTAGQFAAVAAKGKDGSAAVFVARYSDDDNTSETDKVTIRVPGQDLSKARCLLTDLVRTCTEVPPTRNADGSVTIRMQPNSFALIEF